MCGRLFHHSRYEDVLEHFGDLPGSDLVAQVGARYNVAPGSSLLAVRANADGWRYDAFRWGFIPSWSANFDRGLINARSETVAKKPSFRRAFASRRCLIPANGFYEWQKRPPGPKQPFAIVHEEGALLGFAGLYERWSEGKKVVTTCCILTREAAGPVAPIHARMPVIVAPMDYEAWLTGSPRAATKAMGGFSPETLHAYPISRAVNVPAQDGPFLLDALPDEDE